MVKTVISHRGRGTVSTPKNRFEELSYETDLGEIEAAVQRESGCESEYRPSTEVIQEDAHSLITANRSPDIGFGKSLNPYRGCEHGCAYCYARPYHEYLGYNAGLDFETKIVAKKNAAEILEQELSRKGWKPEVLAMSGITDCYQPIERELHIARSCLQILLQFRNPVAIITKNALVTRDIDLLQELASFQAVGVTVSITSLDSKLARALEPRASQPEARLRTLRQLAEADIPCGVSVAPVIPGLNDHEIPAILDVAADCGASWAGYGMLRLPHGVKEIFSEWLDRYFPGRKELVLGRQRELQGGSLNNSQFGTRFRGSGPIADQIQQLYRLSLAKTKIPERSKRVSLSTTAFRRCLPGQLELF